jgi:hypothetical protein
VIRVNLPENAIIDLKSFRWVINSATGGVNATATPTYRQIFPFVQALIQRLEVSVNGSAVSPGFNEYNTAFRQIRNARVPTSKSLSIDASLQNQTLDTSVGTATASAQNIAMVCQDWIGFFGDPSTRFIDTGKTGVISVAITLADDAVLPVIAADSTTIGSAATFTNQTGYSLDQFYFTIDCISLNDGQYDQLLAGRIASDGYLPLSWNEYVSFQQDNLTGSTNQVRFALSTQSLNKLYGTLRPANYINRGRPVTSIVAGTLTESFQPYFFNFQNFAAAYVGGSAVPGVTGNNTFRWGYTINNSPHPAYALASEIEGLNQLIIAENKVFLDSPGNQIGSLMEYRNNKFCAAIRLNHPIDMESKNKYVSGYDTRGVNSQMVFTIQGMAGVGATTGVSITNAYSAYILAETTSSLRIGSGRQLELVQ